MRHPLFVHFTCRAVLALALGWLSGVAHPGVAAAAGPDPKLARLWLSKCASCHGEDGKGETTKGREEGIRSMVTAAWQKEHTDAQVRKTIQDGLSRTSADGKKQTMDGYGAKLTAEQVDALLAFVRALGPGGAAVTTAPTPATAPAPTPTPAATPAPAPAVPAVASGPAKATLARGQKVWKASCAACHGTDGKGQTARGKKLGLADLTSPAWQAEHTDAQVAALLAPGAKVKTGGTETKHLSSKLKAGDADAVTAWVRTLARKP